jgi:VWFA-related protein
MLGIVLALPLGSLAQALPDPDAAPRGAVTGVQQRVVPPATFPAVRMTVTTADGSAVKRLDPADCTVTVQGQPVPILRLNATAEEPRSFAVLLDTAGSAQATFAAEQQAASAIVDRLRPSDEALLMGFDTDVTLLADFTGHRAALDAAIQAAPLNASVGHYTTGTLPPIGKVDGALLYDAVHLAVQRLAQEAGRRILIVIGNGVDQGSRTSLHQVIREAQQAHATIYGLLVHDAGVDELMEVNGKGPMRQLAEATGGAAYAVNARGKGLKPAIAALGQEFAAGWRVNLPASAAVSATPKALRIACKQQGRRLKVRAPKMLMVP